MSHAGAFDFSQRKWRECLIKWRLLSPSGKKAATSSPPSREFEVSPLFRALLTCLKRGKWSAYILADAPIILSNDIILHYRKDVRQKGIFNQPFTQYTDEYVSNFYRFKDADGRAYTLDNLAAPGAGSRGHPYFEFLGVARYWSVICTNTWPNQALYASQAYKEERNMPVFFFLKPIRLMIANHNCPIFAAILCCNLW